MMKLQLIRDVTQSECHWLSRDFKKGEVLYEYTGCTYGCITPDGIACSLDGEIPFFELPESALKLIPEISLN